MHTRRAELQRDLPSIARLSGASVRFQPTETFGSDPS